MKVGLWCPAQLEGLGPGTTNTHPTAARELGPQSGWTGPVHNPGGGCLPGPSLSRGEQPGARAPPTTPQRCGSIGKHASLADPNTACWTTAGMLAATHAADTSSRLPRGPVCPPASHVLTAPQGHRSRPGALGPALGGWTLRPGRGRGTPRSSLKGQSWGPLGGDPGALFPSWPAPRWPEPGA